MLPGPFLLNFGIVFGTLGPQKWRSRVGEVLFLRKSRFSEWIRFWIDFLLISGSFRGHVGEHFGIKIASKNQAKNQSDFGSILEGCWLPIWVLFGPILAPRIDPKSRSIFIEKRDGRQTLNLRVRGTRRGSGRT